MLSPKCDATDTYVQSLLKRVLDAQRIGSCGRSIGLQHYEPRRRKACESIDLKVPYANQFLKWTILFDLEFPELGPDFIFNDDNFLADPDVDTLAHCVPSLANWNHLDSNSLLIVLKELLSHYKRHQVQLLKNYGSPRLSLEYESLVANENIREDDVEVILLNPGMKTTEAKFLIRLVIDFSKLPQRIKHPQNDAAMLLVTFTGLEWCHVNPQLYLTKSIEELFGTQEHLQIPPYPGSQSLLIDYVPEVMKFLADKVENLILCFKKKKDFMSSLLVLLRGSVIEYDAAEFSQATVLVEKKDFHFFIHFHIPATFPREKPEVILQSAYHMDQTGKLITQSVVKFPFNMQSDPLQMINSILSHIEEREVENFQAICTKKYRI